MHNWDIIAVISICFLLSTNIVTADYQLSITLKTLVLDGKTINGEPCSPYYGTSEHCYPRPRICVEPVEISNTNTKQCAFGSYIDLGVFDDTNSITFKEHQQYGGWSNPNTFYFSGYYAGFNVKVGIWNADGTNYQVIDNFMWNVTGNTAISSGSETMPNGISDRVTEFTLDWSIMVPTEATVPPTTAATGATSKPSHADCSDVTTAGSQKIMVDSTEMTVYCDGIGGTAIQRRIDESGGFDTRNFVEYQKGFGTVDQSFWLGLDNIRLLTGKKEYQAVITVCCKDTGYAETYSSFKVNGNQYTLTVDSTSKGHLNDKGDLSAKTDNGQPFSTLDNLNSVDKDTCASIQGGGGWWFGSCKNNLNGHYYADGATQYQDPNACQMKPDELYKTTGPGISYPVQISYQKTQIVLYSPTKTREVYEAVADAFCKSP